LRKSTGIVEIGGIVSLTQSVDLFEIYAATIEPFISSGIVLTYSISHDVEVVF